MILLTHPAQIYQADSKNKDLGKSYMIQDKAIKILQLTVGVAKYCVCVCVTRVSMRCPKFRFPIGVIVFDELELCSYLCKSLSTASLFSFFHTKRNVILIKHNIRVYCIVCFPLLSIAFSCMSKLQLFYSVSAV